jgi:ribonuclease HI
MTLSLSKGPRMLLILFFVYTQNARLSYHIDMSKKVFIWTDGACRGNPGPASTGIAARLSVEGELIYQSGTYLGITTNNQAEYRAVLEALVWAKKNGYTEVEMRMDSLLVVNQLKGIFKVKNRDLWPIYQEIKDRLDEFTGAQFSHVLREYNREADAAANRVLDEQN